jgi:ABC-type branched-subunit amino acid transport system ATPase component
MRSDLLQLEGLCVGYGKGDVVSDASISVAAGRVVTIIGPNGAGKSTLIKSVIGVVKPRIGSVRIDGQEVAGLAPSEIARHGVAFVPQEQNVFRTLSVRENLEMGAWIDRSHAEQNMATVFDIFPLLKAKLGQRAGNLSGGQRQMVAFGMGLMVEPRLLLLDEPSAGLSPLMIGQMFEAIERVKARGIAILMVEQNALQALRISDEGIVMATGRVALRSPALEMLANQQIGDLYLGTRE